MKYSIDELYDIIDEIENEENLTALEVRKRKHKRRKYQKREETKDEIFSNLISFGIRTFLYVFIVTRFVFSTFNGDIDEDNLFDGNEIVATDEEVEDAIANLEKELGVEISSEDLNDYLLFNAVFENENLTALEKDVIYQFLPIIRDNPYINKEYTYKGLLNVDINNIERPSSYEDSVEGTFSLFDYGIDIFVDDEDNRVLKHELVHCIFVNEDTTRLPESFLEGMTEVLANEYFSGSTIELKNYVYETIYVKLLCEIVGSDRVLVAFTTGNMNVIYDCIDNCLGVDNSKDIIERFDAILMNYDDVEAVDRTEISDILLTMKSYGELSMYENDSSDCSYLKYIEILQCLLLDYPYDEYVFAVFDNDYPDKIYFNKEFQKNNGYWENEFESKVLSKE